MENLLYSDFRSIVLNNVPLIDVRAPIEYEKGAFKNSVNLPIMDDEQRCLVGTMYKEKGNEEATKLGYELVSGDIKAKRIQDWKDFLTKHPNAILYCFRGGSRSRIAQEWIYENLNLSIPRIDGGYKAFRNYLIDSLDPETMSMKPIILGGYTGTGKTIILNKLNNQIDLEGLANHRGSGFGRHVTEQPTQIGFENDLAYDLIQKQAKGYKHLIFEDESVHIGRCYIPRPLFEYISSGELVVIERSFDQRVQIILDEYVVAAQKEYIDSVNDFKTGMNLWYDYIVESMLKIKKRFGEERINKVLGLVKVAFDTQFLNGSVDGHRAWISIWLSDYYDAMYQYQLEKTTKVTVFKGDEQQVIDFLNQKQ